MVPRFLLPLFSREYRNPSVRSTVVSPPLLGRGRREVLTLRRCSSPPSRQGRGKRVWTRVVVCRFRFGVRLLYGIPTVKLTEYHGLRRHASVARPHPFLPRVRGVSVALSVRPDDPCGLGPLSTGRSGVGPGAASTEESTSEGAPFHHTLPFVRLCRQVNIKRIKGGQTKGCSSSCA